jgi:taurine dioxygenase
MNGDYVVAPLTPFIGAEISGLDLSKPLNEATLSALRKVWLERKVLFFHDQTLTPDQQVNFARQFAEVEKYPFLNGIDGNSMVAPILKLPHEKINFGGVWHSDTAYLKCPAMGAVLYALEVPPVGGDTIWCNMVSAWETLPDELKRKVKPLKAVNISTKAEVSKTREDRLREAGDPSAPKEFVNIHPVVRTHPETGEEILYVNEAHTERFDGWGVAESETLLLQLYLHQRKPEFQCRFRWRRGSVAMWDNRSTHHYPINDYHGYRRLLHRVSLKGDEPV